MDRERLQRANLLFPEPEHDMERLWAQTQQQVTFKGGASIVSVPDGRSFVPSSVRYLSNEHDEIVQGAAGCPVVGGGAGSSLAAVRSVLQDVHVVDGAKSETDPHAAATTASAIVADTVRRKVKKKENKVQAVQEWPCDGPGCRAIMRCKTEWQRYYNKY